MLHVSSNRRLAAGVTGHGEVARPANSGDERSRGWALQMQRVEAHRVVAVDGAGTGYSGNSGGRSTAMRGRGLRLASRLAERLGRLLELR